MSQIDGNIVVVPTIISGVTGSLAFMPAGLTTSSYEVTGSALEIFIRETASFTIDAIDNQLTFKIPATSSGQSQDVTALFITSSGLNPRVGIGTTNPLTVFDFKDVEDSTTGTELLLRSSRTTEGAQVGDSAGVITFAIDSASFNNIKVSGSIATVEAVVSDIDSTGVTGDLILSTANAKSESPVQRVKIGISTEITGTLDVSSDISSSGALFISGAESFVKSLKIGTTLPLGTSTLAASGLVTFTDNVNLGNSAGDEINIEGITTITGNITASGNISASGDIIANTFTASSALVENTLQFQTQSSPPTAVAGTLYLDSNYDLYIAQ